MRVVVIGGGLTGLSAAHTLRRELSARTPGAEVVLLEARPHAGGHARTLRERGFLVEAGPNAFLDREPEVLALVEELGLTPQLVEARAAAARRFILRRGVLHQVPESPQALLTSQVLSWPGKLRLIAEPFARRAPIGVDETVHEFATRRIGREAADVLVDAAVGGISAGDSRRLSVAAQFPMMVEMEREHGSLIKAAIARRGRRSRLVTFSDGLGVLAETIATTLGAGCRTDTTVRGLQPFDEGWRVETSRGALKADAVLLATPAAPSATLLRGIDADAARALDQVVYATVALVALGFDARRLARPLDGYGYLVPRGEPGAILGVTWDSTLFDGRAPEGHVLVRAFLGGARHPHVGEWSDAQVLTHAVEGVSRVLGAQGEPVYAQTFRWPSAIAQYTPGHLQRVQCVRDAVERQQGLWVCGTAYDGVSMNHAVASGRRAGRAMSSHLTAVRPERPLAMSR
jgi:oxygen-dependent protoporphyrinogen oxidase